ncbi:MAG TPA: ATPase [Clostridiales bacterium]|nr:ATPase [Clostridiales bacterium]
MKMVSITGDYSKLNDAVGACLDTGCFHPEHASKVMTNFTDFSLFAEENPFSERLQRISDFLDRIQKKPRIVGFQHMADKEADEKLNKFIKDLDNFEQQKSELKGLIQENRQAVAQLEHFYSLNIDLNKLLTSEFVKVRFGKLPVESYENIKNYTKNPYVLFFPYSKDQSYYWGMYVAPVSAIDEVDRIFNLLFFERTRLPKDFGTPEEVINSRKKALSKAEADLKALDENIKSYFAENEETIMQIYSYIARRNDEYEIKKYATKYKNYFMLVGWIPESEYSQFENALKQIDGIELDYDNPEQVKHLTPPTKLKNRGLFKYFEYFVEMYGVPNYHEIDPTAIVAITYTLLFGIMFADVGQGIILALVGLFMHKFKKMQLGRILIPCGIASTVFGFVFGSLFGFEHALDPLYHSLGLEGKPVEIMESATGIVVVSIGLGVVLIILAMLLSIISSIKQKNLANAIFGHNGIAGMVLYLSLLLVVGGSFMSLELPVGKIAFAGIVLPIILIFFKHPISDLIKYRKIQIHSVSDFFIENFFEMFEVLLSYLTNTLSFMRVGAFVLIHSGMMMAFFALAEMMGGGIGTAMMIVFGNVFVIALEGLLVGIQVLRLEFYEMFSRFYNGDGVLYKPVAVKAE